MRTLNVELFKKVREYLRSSERYSLLRFVQENITKDIDNSGRNPVIKCPFHGSDSSPSFSIVESEGYFQCFGCGRAGDILNLMMFWEEKLNGVKPKASVLMELLINKDPQISLDLSISTIFVDGRRTVEQVLEKRRMEFVPRQERTLHTLLELRTWMQREGYLSDENITTAISYAQSGISAETIRKVLLGQVVNDVIVEDLSDIDLSEYGIDFEEEVSIDVSEHVLLQ